MKTIKYTVTTASAVKIYDKVNFEQEIIVHNNNANKMYLGGSDVSSTNGFHLKSDENIKIRVQQDNELYAISDTTTGDVVVLQNI